MKKLILTICSAIFVLSISAQNRTYNNIVQSTPTERCNTTQVMEELRAQDSTAFDANKIQQEQILQDWIANNYAAFSAQRAVITIPVVVQIWENTSTVSDNNVYEQLQTLNEDFRRLNADASNTPSIFSAVAADCEIEFCLANVDPNGNATTGIIRQTVGGSPSGSELWDATKYLNLFVYGIGGGTLGFTQLASGNANYAVHIGTGYFGKTGASAPYNLGRTATHEVGHWLNLEHMWGSGSCGNDFVSDTPPQAGDGMITPGSNSGCKSHPHQANSCTGNPDGEMFMNYMDYVNDNCMNMFSSGQKTRMISAINVYRPGLLSSSATNCTTILAADFSANQTTVSLGSSVNFTDLSTGGAATWAWAFTGGTPASSTTQNPTGIIYNTVGCYEVQLDITDGSTGSDNQTKTCYINVVAGGACDTLAYPLIGTEFLYTTAGSSTCGTGGYIAGTNAYCDDAKANYFDNYAPYTEITGVEIKFGKANGTGNVVVNVWDNSGASGAPGTIIGTQTISMSSVITDIGTGATTSISFGTAIAITGNFYVGVEIPSGGSDTLALYSNTSGDTNPGIGWELWSDGNWYDMTTSWGGFDVALAIHPVVCSSGGTPTLAADFNASQVNITTGGSVDFTDLSTGGATTWAWTFTSAATTSSTNQNPTGIVYNTAGCYEVQLDITDGATGSDNETKTCYINVTAPVTGCDTLNFPLVGTVSIGTTNDVSTCGTGGYVSGNNAYCDLAKADFFDNYSPMMKLQEY
ncbi:MAG: PKD domain-containing protein [Flavobacteriales bacterium]|nr:PKD domain-containing protein [Flavobacteriales bacterium]